MSPLQLEKGLEKLYVEEVEELGYTYIPATDLNDYRDNYKSPILTDILRETIYRLNPGITDYVVDQAIHRIKNIDAGLLENRNEIFFDYLQNGIEITYYDLEEREMDLVYLVDCDNVDNNNFVVTRQFIVRGKSQKEADIVLFLNGMPLVVVELKSHTSTDQDINSAYRQIKNYQKDVEELFVYNAFNIISDFTSKKVGSITANQAWYKEWKSVDGTYASTSHADYKTLLVGMLQKERYLDIIKNFVFFEHRDAGTVKILAQYHQYFAVKKAVDSTLEAIEKGDGRGGVFWHTKGERVIIVMGAVNVMKPRVSGTLNKYILCIA